MYYGICASRELDGVKRRVNIDEEVSIFITIKIMIIFWIYTERMFYCFGSYMVNFHCHLCALSVAITYTFKLLVHF